MLQAVDICKHYGGNRCARKSTILRCSAGEVHALMGENGAGKSTLAKIIAGSVRPDSGQILDRRTSLSPSHTPLDAQRHGIGIIYQELDLFPNLTVGENIVIGNLHFREGSLVNFRQIEAFCRPFLDQVGLDCDSRTPAGSLSIGKLQLLAIARALSMNARLHPDGRTHQRPVRRLRGAPVRTHRRARSARRVAIVYVSHKMDEIFRICDRVTVLRDGDDHRDAGYCLHHRRPRSFA